MIIELSRNAEFSFMIEDVEIFDCYINWPCPKHIVCHSFRTYPLPVIFISLKWKCMMSPSCTTYSLPSTPSFPGFAHGGFTAILDVVFVLDDFCTDKLFSKSVWITPAHCGAFQPCGRSMPLLPFRRR